MIPRLLLVVGLVVGLAAAGDARAETAPASAPAPSADRIRSAAAEYDAGRRAFTDAKFEEAAIHFENAYHDAPRAEALRNAIRARREAKQLSRAATLAALAASHYADDATTMALVHETLAESAPKLHKVTLVCTPECGVTADGRAVALDDAAKLSFYLNPGPHDLVVSWPGDRVKPVKVNAVAGGAEELKLDAPPIVVASTVGPPSPHTEPTPPPTKEKPLPPVVFYIGAGLTVVGIGATIASGIDAKNNPGVDAVRRDCAGMDESCATYQKGRDAQFRTNVILGGTIGAGVITAVVGTFFTRWWTSPRREPNRTGFMPFATFGTGSGAAGLRGSF